MLAGRNEWLLIANLATPQYQEKWFKSSLSHYPICAFALGPRQGVLFVGDSFEPLNVHTMVVELLDGEVHHSVPDGGAVPVNLARLDPNRVAGANLPRRLPFELNAPQSGQDVQCLPERMSVPCSARSRLERYPDGFQFGRRTGRDDLVQPNRAGEPSLLPFAAGSHFVAENLHLANDFTEASPLLRIEGK